MELVEQVAKDVFAWLEKLPRLQIGPPVLLQTLSRFVPDRCGAGPRQARLVYV